MVQLCLVINHVNQFGAETNTKQQTWAVFHHLNENNFILTECSQLAVKGAVISRLHGCPCVYVLKSSKWRYIRCSETAFRDVLHFLPSEIIKKVRKPPPLCRPSVSAAAAPPQYIQMMKQCWAEIPDMRPDFDQIYQQFKEINKGK